MFDETMIKRNAGAKHDRFFQGQSFVIGFTEAEAKMMFTHMEGSMGIGSGGTPIEDIERNRTR
jgi:hypothetical protein